MRRFKHNMLTTLGVAEKSQDKDFDATVERCVWLASKELNLTD